jgi:N-formylglutamate amidohydrolase
MEKTMADVPQVYRKLQPEGILQPIILSSPHSGTLLPTEIKPLLKPKFRENPEDTDWYIDRLYDFAPGLGMTLVAANYSRYVIDLNRDPHGRALYQDNRVETGLVPTKSFGNESLYVGADPDAAEIARRRATYYDPYYAAINQLIDERKRQFGSVLFFDCHSIKRRVPSIRSAPFPDLIVGTQDGRTADPKLCAIAQSSLAHHSNYQIAYNDPFKGGHLTRSFGKPQENVHAIQLEMSQDLYLVDGTTEIHREKWEKLRHVLKNLLRDLLAGMGSVNEVS